MFCSQNLACFLLQKTFIITSNWSICQRLPPIRSQVLENIWASKMFHRVILQHRPSVYIYVSPAAFRRHWPHLLTKRVDLLLNLTENFGECNREPADSCCEITCSVAKYSCAGLYASLSCCRLFLLIIYNIVLLWQDYWCLITHCPCVIVHRPVVFIQLCVILPCPSSCSCPWSPPSKFLSP